MDKESNKQPLLIVDMNDDSCPVNYDDNNEESSDERDYENDSEFKNDVPTKKCKRRKSKMEIEKKKNDFQKMINENRDLFDMSCDCCSKMFESLDEARAHYSTEHLNPKGYIKTKSGIKLFYRNNILKQIERQTNPDKFKWVCLYKGVFVKLKCFKLNFDIFRCAKCDRTFSCKSTLRKHIKGHPENKNRFECDICKRALGTSKQLERHKRLHENDGSHSETHYKFMVDYFDMTCDQCDAKFTAIHDARQHYKNVHKG